MRLALPLSVVLTLALGGCFDPAPASDTGGSGSSGTAASEDGPATCVPGHLQPCTCPQGNGNQVCNDEGTAYGQCECLPTDDTGPIDDTGPSTTTTGMDSTGPGESSGDSSGESSSSSGAAEDTGETSPVGETSESSGPPPGPLSVGDECDDDAQCMTNVCWNFSDYDPFCFGGACSVLCSTNAECFEAMFAAGAPNPGASSCGADGRCNTMGTGFGAYACAAPE